MQMLLAAAQACADTVSAEDIEAKTIYPALDRLREVSVAVAAAVAGVAFDQGVAQLQPRPADLLQYVQDKMWYPRDA